MEHDPWPVDGKEGLMPVQFYLCISRILDDPPADAPAPEALRRQILDRIMQQSIDS